MVSNMEAYILVILASCIFGSNFLFDNQYQRRAGSGLQSSMIHALIGSALGIVALLIVNFFMNGMILSVKFVPAAIIIAIFASLNSLLYTVCSLRALGIINLSLYSVFAMLGGMVLPSILGMIITDPATGLREPFTVAKAVCFVLIIIALLFTVQKGNGKKGAIYYAGVFVLNGMSGVFSTLVTNFTYTPDKATADAISTGYSIATGIISLVISATAVIIFIAKKQKSTVSPTAFAFAASGGVLNRIANFILVIALTMGMESSVQYPIVTGVVMIASTLLCYLTPEKPKIRDLISVAFAFAGVIALLLIPV